MKTIYQSSREHVSMGLYQPISCSGISLNHLLVKTIALLILLCSVTPALALENIKVGTTTRTIISYAPKNLPKQPALLIACHGYNQDAPYLQGLAKIENIADTAKFVVVYANGLNKAWDISGSSDLKFMETIIDSMYARYHINRNRVYLTGFSMGGMFTYYAATKMADKIAAFAPVSGYPMGGPNATASRPVPILHTHGTADDVCGYGSVQSHIDAWVKFNGCSKTAEIIKPYPANKPTSPASLKRYRNGKNGVEVAFLTLADKGHWWSMDTNQALTSEEVWNFCKRYSLGDEEPEIETIVPENKSFDLLPERDNTFTVTLSDPINCDMVKAKLSNATSSIQLTCSQTGYAKEVTFTLPAGAVVADGEQKLTISEAITEKGGTMGQATFTYYYGIEEVGETLNVDTLYMPDWMSEQTTIGEGIPAGWRRVNTTSSDTQESTAQNTANCGGVRMKYFASGGDFDAGIYLSARDNKTCNMRYGTYTNSRLMLKSGKYTISFNSIYWSEGSLSGNATYNFYVSDKDLNPVFSATSLTSAGTMSERTDMPITGSMPYKFNFTINKVNYYVLDFEMSEGWNSVIFGNILLTTTPSVADTYKGTFYRTLLRAQRSASLYPDADATADLMTVINLYQDFASTSPTAYSKATAELEAALVVFDAADKGDPVSVDMPSASSCSPLRCYSLTGIRTNKAVPGINIIKSDGGNAKKVVNR